MIKKLSEALIEFEKYQKVYEQEEGGDEGKGGETKKDFQSKFDQFKQFLTGITGSKSSGGANPLASKDSEVSSARSYETGSGDFSNVDKMIKTVVKYLNKHGITNPLVQRAILACIGKESGFTATKEASYKTTSPARIRQVFGSRFSGLSDEEINKLKQDDAAFWDKVYGGDFGRKQLGNTQPGDGAKYLGRGFNGITGRATYQVYSDMLKKAGTNVDLIANPEILEKSPDISAEVNALYFLRGLSDPLIKRKYGNKDPNDFKDFDTALKAVINTNAGSGTDITKGFAKVSYDAAISANNKLGSKFQQAISGGEESRTA